MRLMFDNAWLYNRKTSRVYKYCTKLSEVFESNIDLAMKSLGYCCGQKVSSYSRVIDGLLWAKLVKTQVASASHIMLSFFAFFDYLVQVVVVGIK